MISVLKPLLPPTDSITPYLKEIEQNRWYSNHGPLSRRFEARAAALCGLEEGQAVTFANGTLALMVALMGLHPAPGSLCILPSWTFTATPASAVMAGLVPYFIDVDRETQTFTPADVLKILPALRRERHVGAVMVVAPFGSPIDSAGWDAFTEETGIPVVIDGAAAFDAVASGLMPVGRSTIMISLHATKTLGVGEGALLCSRDGDLLKYAQRISNFGFLNDSRQSFFLGTNAKMTEYTAAVGLAALDRWPQIRGNWARVRDMYMQQAATQGFRCFLSEGWAASTCNLVLPLRAWDMLGRLAERGIDGRIWWLKGCHQHPAYHDYPRAGVLPNTVWLGESVLGVPFAQDMGEAVVIEVCSAVRDLLSAPVS